jgi:hypothetical protein
MPLLARFELVLRGFATRIYQGNMIAEQKLHPCATGEA